MNASRFLNLAAILSLDLESQFTSVNLYGYGILALDRQVAGSSPTDGVFPDCACFFFRHLFSIIVNYCSLLTKAYSGVCLFGWDSLPFIELKLKIYCCLMIDYIVVVAKC